jgi:serine/threonine-protein kinase
VNIAQVKPLRAMDERERLALQLLRDALDVPAERRIDFVSQRCGTDAGLRARVDALLRDIVDTDFDDDAPDANIDAPTDALIGTRLGAFIVVERVGRGGMGVVYRGMREGADFTQEVALKLIRRGYDFDDVHARFLRERRILSRLAHPNLARFIDGGVAPDGRPWFALEFVRGETLTRWCDVAGIDVRARVRLFLDVCAAVQYAHDQLVVHRDLKPANVLVDGSGAVRLLDFGIARLLADEESDAAPSTAGVRRALTPEYAAPEQFGGEPAGVATDVYSLGVILYELVTGVLPYEIDRHDTAAAERSVRQALPQAPTQAIVRAPRREESADHDAVAHRLEVRATSMRAFRQLVRGDLSRILDTALAKEPQRRYANVAAFADDLRNWLEGSPVRVSGNSLAYRLRKFVQRNALTVGVAASLGVALVAASTWAIHSAWRERKQRDAALVEVARSNAVVDYVMLMFREAGEHGGGTLTARDVLQAGASQIATRFADQPETGQRVALKLAGLYARLGDTEGATPLLVQVLAWPGIEHNPDVQADARGQLAEVEYFRSHIPRARELLEQARAWWATDPLRHAKVLNESLITRSQIERAEGHADASIATLEQAIAERRILLGGADRDLGIALGTLSVALIQAGRYDDAMRSADQALDVFRSLGKEHSVEALAALSNRGTAAMDAGLFDAAERDLRAAAEQRHRLYGPSPELAQVQNNLGLVLVRTGRNAQAIELFERSLAMAIERGGETTRYALALRGNLAEAYVGAGRVAEAEPLAQNALRIARAQLGESSPFFGYALRAEAAVRIAQGRYDEARKDLDAARSIFSAMGRGGTLQLATLDALRSRLPTR